MREGAEIVRRVWRAAQLRRLPLWIAGALPWLFIRSAPGLIAWSMWCSWDWAILRRRVDAREFDTQRRDEAGHRAVEILDIDGGKSMPGPVEIAIAARHWQARQASVQTIGPGMVGTDQLSGATRGPVH